MKHKKLFTSVLFITTSLFLLAGCGEKAQPVSAEPVETINEVDTEESTEGLENPEPSPTPSVEPTEDPVEESSENEVDTPEENTENTESTNESTGIEIVEELDLQMYVQTSANARSGDSTDFEVVTTFSTNTELHVTGRTANDWYRIEQSEGEVYISGKLLGTEKVVIQQQSTGGNTSNSGNNGSTGNNSPQQPSGGQTPPANDDYTSFEDGAADWGLPVNGGPGSNGQGQGIQWE